MGDIKTSEANVADKGPGLSYTYSQLSTSSVKRPFVTSRKGKNAIGTSDQKMPVKIIIADMKKQPREYPSTKAHRRTYQFQRILQM